MRAEIDAATGHVHASIDADRRRRRVPERPRRDPHGDRARRGSDRPRPRRARCRCRRPRPGATRPISRSTATGRSSCTRRSSGRSTTGTQGAAPRKTATVAESFGHVTNPYPREYLALAPDIETLDARGGRHRRRRRSRRRPRSSTRRARRFATTRTCGRGSSRGAIALFLLDLLVRRVRLFDRKRTFRRGDGKRAGVAAA